MGALYAIYKMNFGSPAYLEFWEKKMVDNHSMLHIQDIIELLKGFNMSLHLKPEYMHDKLNKVYKKILLEKWKAEAVYHQRMGHELMLELDFLGYYDEEIWMNIHNDILGKKRINNIYFFKAYYETFTRLNNDPTNPLYKKLDKALAILSTKHYTEDRQWRYTLENGGRMRTLEELI